MYSQLEEKKLRKIMLFAVHKKQENKQKINTKCISENAWRITIA